MSLDLLFSRGGSRVTTQTATGEVRRAPLYVTAPWKRWAAPDLFPNIAALVVVSGGIAHPTPEPTFYKRSVQVDHFPNLAVATPVTAYVPRALIEPLTRRSLTGVDLYPNLAVGASVPAATPRTYLDPVVRRAITAVEIFPNLAVRGDEAAQMMLPGVDGQTFARHAPDIDLAPNLAVRGQAPVYVPPPPLEIPASRRWSIPDLAPNIAVRVTAYVPPAPLDIAPARRTTQPDLYPNIAVQFAVLFLPTALDVPTFHRTPPQIDLYPNLAVGVQGYVPPGSPEPVLRRSLTAVELYPNLAVLAPVAPTPLLIAVEPWINKRYSPQVEVFQNQAVYAPAESVPALQNELAQQTDLAKARITVAPDVFPNLAVEQDVTPVPPIVIPTTGTNDNNPRSAEGEYRFKSRRRKQKLPELPDPVFISPASFEHVPPQAVIDLVPDFTSLAQTLGAEPAALSRAIDVEIARLMAEQAERDDEEALVLILSALDD